MVDAAFAGTVAFAVGAGLATFFAPCAYPLLPGYVGYYLSQDDAGLGGAFARGVAATVGALLVLGAVGAALTVVGTRIVANLVYVEPVVGVGLVVLGVLVLTDRAPTPHVLLPERRASVAGFGIFGAVYAVAAAGCVVPVVLGVFTQSVLLPPEQAAVALGSYAVAVALPLTVVTVLAAAGRSRLQSVSKHVGSINKVAGAIMVLAGLGQIVLSLTFVGIL